MTDKTDKHQSLLSFLYNVMYDDDTRRAFHTDEGSTVRSFGLSDDFVKLLVNIGKTEGVHGDAGNRPVWDDLLRLLGDELHDNRTIFW